MSGSIFLDARTRNASRRSKLWPKRWWRSGTDRSSLILAFGGGIVNDMAGFLAAIFMRGIPVVQIPTMLLAQVDAAVGGKTGVNLAGGKNLLGAFHQTRRFLCHCLAAWSGLREGIHRWE